MQRTLKYAILGLIASRPRSGYDISTEFNTTLSEFWNARHSQIYPELKKLTEEGMIQYEVAISGQVLEKKIYSITPAGKKDFMNWLSKDVPMEPTAKDIFRLRMYYSGQLSREDRRMLLESQLEQHIDRLEHLKQNQKKFSHVPDPEEEGIGDYLVLLGAIMREETTIQWLKECIRIGC